MKRLPPPNCATVMCLEPCPAGQYLRINEHGCETCDCYDPCEVYSSLTYTLKRFGSVPCLQLETLRKFVCESIISKVLLCCLSRTHYFRKQIPGSSFGKAFAKRGRVQVCMCSSLWKTLRMRPMILRKLAETLRKLSMVYSYLHNKKYIPGKFITEIDYRKVYLGKRLPKNFDVQAMLCSNRRLWHITWSIILLCVSIR